MRKKLPFVRHFLMLVVLVPLSGFTNAQELVPNGSFELYNSCPDTISGLAYSPSYTYFPTVQAWVDPIYATADYYNSCSNAPGLKVPMSGVGYQPAHSGQAFVGGYSYYGSKFDTSYHYREYIMTKLLKPMVKDSPYCVRFFVSPIAAPGRQFIVTKAYGAHFSDTIPALVHQPSLDVPYHILNDTTVLLSDTSRWNEIKGVYVAHGGERFMTIGNFGPNTAPPYVLVSGANFYPIINYVFIDDVSVKPLRRYDSVRIHSICNAGDSIVLRANAPDGPYRWNTGDTTQTLTVRNGGAYWCRGILDCGIQVDTFYVTDPPHVDSVREIDICNGAPIDLQLTSRMASGPYEWSTGDTSKSIRLTTVGYFRCSVLKGCVRYNDEFNIVAKTAIAPKVRDTSVCQFSPPLILRVADTGLVWFWSLQSNAGSSTQPVISTEQAKRIVLYVATKRGTCVSAKATITVTIIEKPAGLPTDTLVRCDDIFDPSLLLGEAPVHTTYYEWSTGDTGCCIRPPAADGLYIRRSFVTCGPVEDGFYVRSEHCEHCIFFPDAFTPNDDGRNDGFKAIVRCPTENYSVSIYNRWGERVYSSTDKNGSWDGKQAGVTAPVGVYMYVASFRHPVSKREISVKGDVMLIR